MAGATKVRAIPTPQPEEPIPKAWSTMAEGMPEKTALHILLTRLQLQLDMCPVSDINASVTLPVGEAVILAELLLKKMR